MSVQTTVPNRDRRFGSADTYVHMRAYDPEAAQWMDYLFTPAELAGPGARAAVNAEDLPKPPGRLRRAWLALFGP